MKKLILVVCVAVAGLLCPSRCRADQFAIPYVTHQSTTITNASLILSTAGFPSPSYMNCVNHWTISDTVAGQFMVTIATSSLLATTTIYAVTLSSGVPYDSQWSSLSAYCAPPNNIMNLIVTSGNYTISAEKFVTQGMSP